MNSAVELSGGLEVHGRISPLRGIAQCLDVGRMRMLLMAQRHRQELSLIKVRDLFHQGAKHWIAYFMRAS